jgi:hypothetical protein
MKKSTGFLGIFFLSFIFLTACSKKDQPGPLTDPPEQNVYAPLSVPLFDELNETIARFDPLYLQIVYKDKRSIEEINDEAARLMNAINQNPTSLVIQKELIELYHFKSFADLQKASNIISTNSGALKKTFLGKDTVLSKAKMHQLNEARNTFLKNKISSLEKASQRRSSGLWTDNADNILEMWHYFSAVANQELELDMDGGGGCNESCCFEYHGCLINASSNYRLNFIILGSTLAASGGSLGALYGSIIPFIGTIAVGTGAGIIGGVTGYIQAVHIFMNDQNVCALNYKACILKKNGN